MSKNIRAARLSPEIDLFFCHMEPFVAVFKECNHGEEVNDASLSH